MITYTINDPALSAAEFCDLCKGLWSRPIDPVPAGEALRTTTNITARDDVNLIGCARVLTDGGLVSFITEVLVRSEFNQQGVGEELLRLAYKVAPTHVIWPGIQPIGKEMMLLDGWKPAYAAYAKLKPLNDRDSVQSKENESGPESEPASP